MTNRNAREDAARNGTVPARLSREGWLARALEVLGKKGAGQLAVESLARQLGVTKGSFYWHFRDRDDFFRIVHDGQKTQVTLNQQLGFARPGRRLDDEGSRNIECLDSRLDIVLQQLFVSHFMHDRGATRYSASRGSMAWRI